MKTKALITSFILLLYSNYNFGQTRLAYTDGVAKFIAWISDIDEALKNITDKEKLKTIDRQLGYASYDIDKIAWKKEYLATRISDLSNAKDTDQLDDLKPLVDELIIDIDKLIKRLWSIKGELSQTDQRSVDGNIHKIVSSYRNKKRNNLVDIRGFLIEKETPLNKVKEEAKQAKAIADAASIKIKEAKAKIRMKLN